MMNFSVINERASLYWNLEGPTDKQMICVLVRCSVRGGQINATILLRDI